MKQLITLKLLGLFALSIATFPAFTMDNEHPSHPYKKNGYLSYNKLTALPKTSEKNSNHTVTCYKILDGPDSSRWICPNPYNKRKTEPLKIETKKFITKMVTTMVTDQTKESVRNLMKKKKLGDESKSEEFGKLYKNTEDLYNELYSKLYVQFHSFFYLTRKDFENPDNWDS